MDNIAVVLLDAGQKSGLKPVTKDTFDRAKCQMELIAPIKALLPKVHQVIVVVRADGSIMAEEAAQDVPDFEPPYHESTPTTRELLKHFSRGDVEFLIPLGHWWSRDNDMVAKFARDFAFKQGATKVVQFGPGEALNEQTFQEKLAKSPYYAQQPELVH